ncbi:MAG TPA: acyl-CoA dehydrogenase family protein [Acidimicrobiales bacterium]|nr:acyl-CoA dehydrogenase family protein [Acidimicrobiales bacterium]
MDFAPDEELELLHSTVAGVVGRYGHGYFVEQARSGGSATELWRSLAAHGFVGVNIPAVHGGGGRGILELAIVEEECAAGGCPLLMLLVSPAICGSIIARYGTPEQQAQWLPGLGSGEERMAFAITEPDAGSNSHRISTVATRDGSGWRLRGTKYYISGVDDADRVLVVARTGVDERTGRAELSLFVVDSDAGGLTRQRIPVEILSTERQFTLWFDDVRVSPDRLVGAEGGGLRPLFDGLNPERVLSAALLNGIGRYALAKAAAYANERRVWDVPIGAHQGVAHPLAQAAVHVELARLMTHKAAWLYDHGADAAEASNMAKFAAADAALEALDAAVQAHGGNGMATEYGLSTMWGMARLLKIAPVSREMLLNFVAQHTLGLPRSY